MKWHKIAEERVNYQTYNEYLQKLIDDKVPCENTRAISALKAISCYSVIKSESRVELRFFDNEKNCFRKLCVQKTNIHQQTYGAGYEAFNFINDKFYDKYKTTLFQAFSGKKYKQEYSDIKKCVPKQIDYLNRFYQNRIIDNIYKSDVSSAYPTQLCKDIPTLHDCKRVTGRVEPTEEYPFAFYVKSKTLKIYNELDINDYINSKYYKHAMLDKWNPINVDEDETILCKKSEYSLKSIFEELYNDRKEHDEYKLYMNACIGFFHKNSNPTLSMIAAVVIARCANDMLKRCEIIEKEGNTIILINTDSICWMGNQSSVSENEKYLGSFTKEYENIKMCCRSVKCYQLQVSESETITRFSGLPKESQNTLAFGDILKKEFSEELAMESVYFFDDNDFIKEIKI